ncbi:MAG: GtrA family protein [Acidobacteriota bacterium]|nr:GtrA family protein [Acidobacteriota bacterium]
MISALRSALNMFGGLNFIKLRLIRFALVGVVNTAFGFTLYAIFLFMGANYNLANFFALTLSVIVGFFAQMTFVFGRRDKFLFLRFVIVWVVMYFVNVTAIAQLIRSGFDAYSAGAIIAFPGAILSYFLQKLYVFRVF